MRLRTHVETPIVRHIKVQGKRSSLGGDWPYWATRMGKHPEQLQKTIKGEFSEAEIAIPRDRSGEFEPQLVKKRQTRFDGFDDKILSLYTRGMTVRDIQAQLVDLYGVQISAGLISNITEAVEEERKA